MSTAKRIKMAPKTSRDSGISERYVSKTKNSELLYSRAKRVLPKGVSYGIRFFDPYPFYTARAKGSRLFDVDGNEYVDFWLGHTALILGHSPPQVMEVVKKQLDRGTQYGTSHELEIALAEQVLKMVPRASMIRFTNSGTEASMYAARLARACTGREKIAKFIGGWHGGYDGLHVGVKFPFYSPESAGLTNGATQNTILFPFNDLEGTKRKMREDIAAVFIEPILGAGGAIPAEPDFLKGLKELCTERDILLVFDEVISGFRLAPGGGQEYYGVYPDITVFGKILGGGFPVGAFCAKTDIMERLDSTIYERPTNAFHGGTFAGNPITMIAGLATLKTLENGKLINELNDKGDKLRHDLLEIFERHDVDVQTTGAGSIFNIHFAKEEIKNSVAASRANKERLLGYNLHLIANGVFILPTHAAALCTEHSPADIQKLLIESERFAKTLEKN